MTKPKLPFDLTVEATEDWLQSLSKLNSVNSANQLNKVVRKLRKTNADKVLQTLIQLTPTILYISNNLETSLLAETDNKISQKSLKIKKLAIQLLRNLSLAFCTVTDKKTLSTEEKNQALYISLQLIGYTQRITTIFQEFPSTTLWRKTAELYTLAQKRNVLCQEIKQKIKAFKTLADIETVLKRNLLFSMLTPYRYTSSHIKELFLISEQHAQLLRLNQEYSADYAFSWDPESESGPYYKNTNQLSNNSSINIDIEKLLSFIQSTAFSSKLEKNDVLTQLIEPLSGFQEVFETTIHSAPVSYHLITGLADITKYLKNTNKINMIQQLSSQLKDSSPVKNMTLEPMEFEKNYLAPPPSPTSSDDSVNLPKNAQPVKILQTKYKQYIIALTNTTDCSIGNIVLLCKAKVNLELGIIRQIQHTKARKITNFLIEKIPGTPSFQRINSPETEKKQIILLQKQNSKPELILPPCKFYNGTPIELESEQTLTLNKLIDYSPFFMHYLSY